VQGKNFSLVPSVYIDNAIETDDEVLEFEDEIEKLNLVINHQFQTFEKVAKEMRTHLHKWGS
jgi:cell division protein FtsX